MGNGISHRRIGRQHSGVGSAPPRVIPLPPGYPGSSAGPPYPPNAHHLSYYYPPNYHAAGPPSMDQQIYQQAYTNGQILMNMPSHVFRPVNSSASCPRPVPIIPIVAEHQKANTIRNDVNLRKATLRLEKDNENPGHYLVAFSFDATVIGSICIFFLAKEGFNCSLTPLKPQLYKPVRVPFEKGLGQNFCQAPGTGVDLSLFSDEDLSKDGQDEVYALVVRTEAIPKNSLPDALSMENEALGAPLPKWIHSQTTHAVIERREGGEYGVRVVKQIIWVDGVRYELQEIYGIENSGGAAFEGNDSGKECVICMSEPRDTTVLPCRHMCMCSECAKVLRFQTNRCPICRSPVERLLEIRVPKGDCLDPVDGGQIKQGGESGLSTSTEGEPDGHKLSSVH